jgi:fatty acid omega-hydroxylase
MVEETPWQQALRYENRANPYPFYEQLRKTPVARQPDGTYVVSTYREVVALLHDPRVSSDKRKRAVVTPDPFDGMIITEDPPEHDVDRRRMNRHFGPPVCPRMIADLEPDIRSLVAQRLDAMKGKTRIDVVDEFAFPIPVTMICRVLGVPLESVPDFHGWIETALDGLDFGPEAFEPDGQRRAVVAQAAVPQLIAFLADLLDQYRKEPASNMFSGMVNDGGPEGCLSADSAARNAALMLFAGHETSVNLISNCVLALLRHPDQLEKLRQDPGLIVPGVEEILRLESSVQFWHSRCALEDIEIAGTTIPQGAPIFLAYASANRDPQRFENPDKLDLERPDNEHVGFSQGIHYCFGAPLARLEVQIAVSEFFRRVQNPRLVEDPPPYRRNQIFRGPLHLWLDIDGIKD